MRSLPPQPVSRRSLVSSHRILAAIALGLALATLVGLIVWQVLRVTTPPELIIAHPPDNFLSPEPRLRLEGRAAPESLVTVNGEPTAISRDGSFSEELDLRTGLNIITISASKRFAKPRIIYRRVVVSKE